MLPGNSSPPSVVILGAGPAGTGAAYQLARNGFPQVTVLEQKQTVGGNAGSFDLDGVRCDFGSHRLHPITPEPIMADLRRLLREDLLYRPRRGRIRLQGRWIAFPLKPLDLVAHLPPSFALNVLGDSARKLWPSNGRGPQTFATVLEQGLGRTICREFYFPYARKLWGVDPQDLSPTTAQKRVSGGSIAKMARKVLGQIPGFKRPGAGHFYYPRRGYGQISDSLYEAAREAGAQFEFGASFVRLETAGDRVRSVRYRVGGRDLEIPAQNVWSTIPVTILVRGISPPAPPDVLNAASSLCFRGMILIYLVLERDRFSEYDAYYFPEESIPISRLSEPKNFSAASDPRGRTVLCAELPADPGSPEWQMSDQELGHALCDWIERAGLPRPANVSRVVTRRLGQAYPVYRNDYDRHFSKIDDWLGSFSGLLTFGRQGLFAHDNTHHTLAMAYSAAECLSPDGTFDRARWSERRKEFETHVVED